MTCIYVVHEWIYEWYMNDMYIISCSYFFRYPWGICYICYIFVPLSHITFALGFFHRSLHFSFRRLPVIQFTVGLPNNWKKLSFADPVVCQSNSPVAASAPWWMFSSHFWWLLLGAFDWELRPNNPLVHRLWFWPWSSRAVSAGECPTSLETLASATMRMAPLYGYATALKDKNMRLLTAFELASCKVPAWVELLPNQEEVTVRKLQFDQDIKDKSEPAAAIR